MKKEFWITLIVVVLALGLIAGVIVANKLTPDVPKETVAHDHDGDGVPDHGDDAHEGDDVTVPHDHDGDGVADHGDEAHTDSGNTEAGNTDSGNAGGNTGTGEGNVDISIDLEDVPDGSTPTNPANPTNPTQPGATDPTSPSTGATEPGNAGGSGAVPGNEIDFDDLKNAGQN